MDFVSGTSKKGRYNKILWIITKLTQLRLLSLRMIFSINYQVTGWFSILDLKSGYWQIKIRSEDKEKTAFSIGNGLWQFKVIPLVFVMPLLHLNIQWNRFWRVIVPFQNLLNLSRWYDYFWRNVIKSREDFPSFEGSKLEN